MDVLIQSGHIACRKDTLASELVIVDGLPGCGKTLFTAIVAAVPRVELLQYSAVLENICALYHLKKITKDAAIAMLRIEFDLVLYETMMSRNTNFRPKDLSSAFRDIKIWTYIRRLFEKGDELIPQKILNEKPILHFATHNLLGFADILMNNIVKKLSIIEIVRHPLYMIVQQTLNQENWIKGSNASRQFHLFINKNENNVPYYVNEWELDYAQLKPVERAIYEMDYMTKKVEILKKNQSKNIVLTIPFESFVLDPLPFMETIGKTLETKITSITKKVMKKQNVPRKKISDGIPLNIYKRCGWEPPDTSLSEKQELEKRRQFAVDNGASRKAMDVLDELCSEYERTTWRPEK